MHTTKIVEVGSLVEEFAAEYLMILFGQQVPPELKDICVVHDNHETAKNVIKTGDILTIGNQEYEINPRSYLHLFPHRRKRSLARSNRCRASNLSRVCDWRYHSIWIITISSR